MMPKTVTSDFSTKQNKSTDGVNVGVNGRLSFNTVLWCHPQEGS